MRLLLLSTLLTFSHYGYTQDCDQTSFPQDGGSITCATLKINSKVEFNRVPMTGSVPIEFIVHGDVEINADIILNGNPGFAVSTDTVDGPAGGQGASDGGGVLGFAGQPHPDLTLSPSDGTSHDDNGVCNHGGGGGGGVFLPGKNGNKCSSGSGDPGFGGLASGFPSPLRGGFGGGAGGGIITPPDLGLGGGGGGALYIKSSGKITIANGVRISARGGRGGNAVALGGAGGGGSGGIIWLEAVLGIENNGIFDVRGGEGGINTKASAPRGGNGGAGGDGVYRLDSLGNRTEGTGIKILCIPIKL